MENRQVLPSIHLREEMLASAECRYGRISFLENDSVIGRALWLYGEWAESEIDLASIFVGPGDTVLDVGANIGTHTIAFASLVGESGKVVGFEPHPLNFEILSRNVRGNGLNQVELVNKALGDSPRALWMDVPSLSSEVNMGAVSAGELHDQPDSLMQRIEIAVDCLDNIYSGSVGLIKIDVEGMEASVLRGAARLLSEQRPVVIAESNSVADSWSTAQILSPLDYILYLHYAPAYREFNFRGEKLNIFGDCGEASLVAVPSERLHGLCFPESMESMLTPVQGLDSLVAAMLRKPQYREHLAEVYGCDVAVCASTVHALRSEIHQLKQSTSWRLLSPARLVAGNLQRVMGRFRNGRRS